MIRIFIKEFNAFLDSLVAYLVVGVFLLGLGALIWIFPATSILDSGYAELNIFFVGAPYAFIFLIPAITMKSLAEEKRLGTLEILLTKPLTNWQIVLGKFMAAFALVFFALVPTLIYHVSLYYLADPLGNIDLAGAITSYGGLLLLGGVFCAIGIFFSSLFSNAILAFVMTGFACITLYDGLAAMATLFEEAELVLAFQWLGLSYHYDAMSRGVVDSRDLVYFGSLIGLMLWLASNMLNYQRR